MFVLTRVYCIIIILSKEFIFSKNRKCLPRLLLEYIPYLLSNQENSPHGLHRAPSSDPSNENEKGMLEDILL